VRIPDGALGQKCFLDLYSRKRFDVIFGATTFCQLGISSMNYLLPGGLRNIDIVREALYSCPPYTKMFRLNEKFQFYKIEYPK
jgi:hypothetical protein